VSATLLPCTIRPKMPLVQQAGPVFVAAADAGARAPEWRAERPRHSAQAWLVAADMVVLWLIAAAALILRFTPELAVRLQLPELHRQAHLAGHIGFLILYSVLVVLFCHAYGLYRGKRTTPAAREGWSVYKAAGLAIGVEVLCICVSGLHFVSRFVIGFAVFASPASLVGWRRLYQLHLERAYANGSSMQNVLIVGCGKQAVALSAYLQCNRQLGYQVCGLVACGEEAQSGHALGTVHELRMLVRRHFVDEVFVTATDSQVVRQVVLEAREMGLHVRLLPDLYGLGWAAPVEYLGLFPALTLHEGRSRTAGMVLKRAIDVTISGLVLAACSPVLMLAAAAIKLSSPGRIIYASERVGRKGDRFRCYKLRTMVADAEAMQASLQHLNQRDRVLFKIRNDPRVTRVGRLLRKYSVDELPQLWNVLKGEMSLVGPRPPLASEVRQYELEHLRRLDVLPGITGLWQVQARTNPSFARYFSLDVDYLERWSPSLDAKILLRTVGVVLRGTGQ